MTEILDKGRQADVLTPEALAEFQELFGRWRDQVSVAESLEFGGRGDPYLLDLADACLSWACQVAQRQRDHSDPVQGR